MSTLLGERQRQERGPEHKDTEKKKKNKLNKREIPPLNNIAPKLTRVEWYIRDERKMSHPGPPTSKNEYYLIPYIDIRKYSIVPIQDKN